MTELSSGGGALRPLFVVFSFADVVSSAPVEAFGEAFALAFDLAFGEALALALALAFDLAFGEAFDLARAFALAFGEGFVEASSTSSSSFSASSPKLRRDEALSTRRLRLDGPVALPAAPFPLWPLRPRFGPLLMPDFKRN